MKKPKNLAQHFMNVGKRYDHVGRKFQLQNEAIFKDEAVIVRSGDYFTNDT